MKLYLVNAEYIYFSQIKEYFREIISSYDNGNYRSAVVMLYSTIVCDLLLKLKELSDVYNDTKAEALLAEINAERKQAGNSSWERKLIEDIRERTELLSDEAYVMVKHIYDLRNFSAHPALNDDYELVSPTQEMTVAYIKKALDDILTKPSVFAQSIVDRMSDDVSQKKERYKGDYEAFKLYLNKVYFQRMSSKMLLQVFRAFWKFTFKKTADDGKVFQDNRRINRWTLEAMLDNNFGELCVYIEQNKAFFTVFEDSTCLSQVCALLAYFPQLYDKIDENVRYQIKTFNESNINAIKWFESGDIEKHLSDLNIKGDVIRPNLLKILENVCKKQGQSHLFYKFLIDHYAKSSTFTSAGNRFDNMIEPYLGRFGKDHFVQLIQAINDNDQINKYWGQPSRNDKIMDFAKSVLPDDFDFAAYEKFKYSKVEAEQESGAGEEESSKEDDFDSPF